MIVKFADYLVIEGIGIRFITPEGRYISINLPWDGQVKVTQAMILEAIKQRLLRESKEEVIARVLQPMVGQEFEFDLGEGREDLIVK